MVRAIRLRGDLDPVTLECSLVLLAERHAMLRTGFDTGPIAPYQFTVDGCASRLRVVDLSDHDAPDAELERVLGEEELTPFDLHRPPLMRVIVFRIAPREHVLSLIVHHLIADGTSLGLIERELAELYAATASGRTARLQASDLEFVDYALWQRAELTDEALKDDLDYWKRALAGVEPSGLPHDHPRSSQHGVDGDFVALSFPPTLIGRLTELGASVGATPFMATLAAFQALLARYGAQDDIAVGVPATGRDQPGLESVIGLFVNTLVIRVDLGAAPDFRTVLQRVRRAAVAAYAHADVPFERVVSALKLRPDTSRNPIFQVGF